MIACPSWASQSAALFHARRTWRVVKLVPWGVAPGAMVMHRVSKTHIEGSNPSTITTFASQKWVRFKHLRFQRYRVPNLQWLHHPLEQLLKTKKLHSGPHQTVPTFILQTLATSHVSLEFPG